MSDPALVFKLIQLDAHDPPEDLWGLALLKVASFEEGKIHSVDEELEFVFDLPYQPDMLDQLDRWLVRIKAAMKNGR
uniref:Uncharacterized protein n=1 Tax=viral metagenome TaxID=1070528 RepID=A0A6M3LZ86_9ZZZZ